MPGVRASRGLSGAGGSGVANSVGERWLGTLKCEHLDRHDIANGIDLADHVTALTADYSATRPTGRSTKNRPSTPTKEPKTPTEPAEN